MLKNQLITPEGTKDYLFEEATARHIAEQKLRALFENRGFCEVITPGLEFLDVFSAKGHGIPVEYMYKLTDGKGRLMAVRPDSTMPIARLCATRLKSEPLPLRLYYHQPVYSATRSLSGRSDEILQTGVELIGKSSRRADLEMIATAVASLEACGQKNFRLELGHIGIFNSLVESLGLGETEIEQIREDIESKNYPALGDMLDRFGASAEGQMLRQLPRLFGGEEVFLRAKQWMDGQAAEILRYLETLYRDLCKLGLGDRITVDLGIVNRTDYYTGIVFKGYIEGHGVEVLSGGRYDSLLGEFGREAGAIGFAVNVDAIAKAELAKARSALPPPEILIHAQAGYEMEGLARLGALTEQGIRAEYSIVESLEEAEEYARQKGILRLLCVGESEREYRVEGIQ
jgi:ATP phosphoribosyltransferase regulatory subunit